MDKILLRALKEQDEVTVGYILGSTQFKLDDTAYLNSLLVAMRKLNVLLVEMLLRTYRIDVNIEIPGLGILPVQDAVENELIKTTKLLVKYGADLTTTSSGCFDIPIFLSAKTNYTDKITKYILDVMLRGTNVFTGPSQRVSEESIVNYPTKSSDTSEAKLPRACLSVPNLTRITSVNPEINGKLMDDQLNSSLQISNKDSKEGSSKVASPHVPVDNNNISDVSFRINCLNQLVDPYTGSTLLMAAASNPHTTAIIKNIFQITRQNPHLRDMHGETCIWYAASYASLNVFKYLERLMYYTSRFSTIDPFYINYNNTNKDQQQLVGDDSDRRGMAHTLDLETCANKFQNLTFASDLSLVSGIMSASQFHKGTLISKGSPTQGSPKLSTMVANNTPTSANGLQSGTQTKLKRLNKLTVDQFADPKLNSSACLIFGLTPSFTQQVVSYNTEESFLSDLDTGFDYYNFELAKARDKFGFTLLHRAIEFGQMDIVAYLLKKNIFNLNELVRNYSIYDCANSEDTEIKLRQMVQLLKLEVTYILGDELDELEDGEVDAITDAKRSKKDKRKDKKDAKRTIKENKKDAEKLNRKPTIGFENTGLDNGKEGHLIDGNQSVHSGTNLSGVDGINNHLGSPVSKLSRTQSHVKLTPGKFNTLSRDKRSSKTDLSSVNGSNTVSLSQLGGPSSHNSPYEQIITEDQQVISTFLIVKKVIDKTKPRNPEFDNSMQSIDYFNGNTNNAKKTTFVLNQDFISTSPSQSIVNSDTPFQSDKLKLTKKRGIFNLFKIK